MLTAFMNTLANIILPIGFLLWLYFSRVANRLHWVSIAALVGTFIVLIAKAGGAWSWFGNFWPTVFLVAFAVVFARSLSKRLGQPWLPPAGHRKEWRSIVISFLCAAFFSSKIMAAYTARAFPQAEAVEMVFPLKGGKFQVVHGGSNQAMNYHAVVPAQKYALDIVALGARGVRADGIYPTDLKKYAIYGAQVVSPCDGEVMEKSDTLPDQNPPLTNVDNPAGNYILIYCQGVSVILAHLQPGSVLVQNGDSITAGQSLALVGNTGNTSEPHMHIHAARGQHRTFAESRASQDGVPLLFDGKFLIRNDIVSN